MKLFFSTGGYKGEYFLQSARRLLSVGISQIELSAGLHGENCHFDVLQLSKECEVMLHNYFPPPIKEFTFNLASADLAIRNKSLELAKEALLLSQSVGAKFYGVHGGFCFDPDPQDLGGTFKDIRLIPKRDAIDLFSESLYELSEFSSKLGVRLLVENNVLSRQNLDSLGRDCMLLTEPNDITALVARKELGVGLLLDTGHLKVTCTSLGTSMEQSIVELNPLTEGYHLSDNSGYSDEHKGFDASVWFMKYLDLGKAFATLEVKGEGPRKVKKLVSDMYEWLGMTSE
jgi:sugar phosphate isomerase/epimerase